MTLLAKSNLLPSVSTLFNDFFDDDRWWNPEFGTTLLNRVPSANVVESENEFNIELAVPGMTKKDFKIDVDNGQVCISSEKKEEKKEERENYTRREFSYNAFSRSFILPETVDAEKINAHYENGLLSVTLPKKAEARKKLKRKEIQVS